MSDTIDDIRARAAKAAATCPFVSPTTGHRCKLPNRHRGPVHSCEPSPSTAGDVVLLLAEVDRLQLFLDCERGIRAPEGWTWCPHDTWKRYDASDPRQLIATVGRFANATGVCWEWRIDRKRRGEEKTALEAMEAADRAAGGGG